MTRIPTHVLLLLTGALFLSACGSRDPYLRDDVWKPTGANAGNLAAMVANPNDLLVGRHTVRSDTKASTVAIQHIWDGQPQPLSYGSSAAPSGASSSSSPSGGSSASPSPGG
jgi:type IV pilus biogenesis protein CpaD/CtpE